MECKGTRTSLAEYQSELPLEPRHGARFGNTQFTLRAEPGRSEILRKEYEGNWSCLGFNNKAKSYVLSGIFEAGAWLVLGSILYVREDTSTVDLSAFHQSHYLALSMIASEDTRYIVFVGGIEVVDGLYVLDVEKDTIRKLGPAPAPPPNPDLREMCGDEALEWGSCWADHYLELESNILRFKSGHVVEASYGRDTSKARAKKRKVRTFDLDKAPKA